MQLNCLLTWLTAKPLLCADLYGRDWPTKRKETAWQPLLSECTSKSKIVRFMVKHGDDDYLTMHCIDVMLFHLNRKYMVLNSS